MVYQKGKGMCVFPHTHIKSYPTTEPNSVRFSFLILPLCFGLYIHTFLALNTSIGFYHGFALYKMFYLLASFYKYKINFNRDLKGWFKNLSGD